MPTNFFQKHLSQRLHSQPMKIDYWSELYGLQLGLKDSAGNALTFYKSDYDKFIKIIQLKKLSLKDLSQDEVLKIILDYNRQTPKANEIQLIKYFSPENLKQFNLSLKKSDFSKDGNIVTQNGSELKKEGHQNCLIMLHNGSIYVHPKVPANIKENVIGINHSSLAKGQSVAFAGSFTHDDKDGWILENTTGHYGTRATQIRGALLNLVQQGFSIENLSVKLWIHNPESKHSKYETFTENAAVFLNRTSQSVAALSTIKISDDNGYHSGKDSPKI